METCFYCGSKASWACECSSELMCESHIPNHFKKSDQHTLFAIKKTLSSDIKTKFQTEVLRRLNLLTQFSQDLQKQTHNLLSKIKSLSAITLKKILIAQNQYSKLLSSKEFSISEVNRVMQTNFSLYPFSASDIDPFLERFYNKNFIKEVAIDLPNETKTEMSDYFLEGSEKTITCVLLGFRDQVAISAGEDRKIRVWNLLSHTCESVFEGHKKEILCICLTKDYSKLASGSHDKDIKIWDMQGRYLLQTLKGHSGAVSCISFISDNSYLVSGSYDCTIRIWDLNTYTQYSILNGHTASIYGLILSIDDKYIFSASGDTSFRVWNLWEKRQEAHMSGFTSGIKSLDITCDGRFIITVSEDKNIRLWDIEKRTQLDKIDELTGLNAWVRISKDGRYFISGSSDRFLKIWDIKTKKIVVNLGTETTTCGAISRGCEFIVTGGPDRKIKVWNVVERMQSKSSCVVV